MAPTDADGVGYRIATDVLEAIVKGCLVDDPRVLVAGGSVLKRPRAVQVTVEDERCHVVLPLEARFGEHLPDVGRDVQGQVARGLSRITGLEVTAVDIIFTGVYPLTDAE